MVSRAALVRHPVAIAGVVLTTISALLFIALVIAEASGLIRNPYAGLIVYVLVPAIFVVGLLLLPLGLWLEARRQRLRPAKTRDWPVLDFGRPTVRRGALFVLALTAVNLLLIALATAGAVHTMETPTFCGQTCHEPMHPQFTAWQAAPHSQVSCTACHVGGGARALIHSKLAGARQLYHVIVGRIPRPIPGVADMRPALEVCGSCHWAGHDEGELLRVKRDFADDEANSETATTLRLLVGGAGRPTSAGRAIHWHADPGVRVEFVYTDPERQTIPYVKSTDRQGRVKEYRVEGTADAELAGGTRRVMDCIDCHNVAAHRIAPTPEQAVDRAIASGGISRELPFVRREGVRLVKSDYATQDEGIAAIATGLKAFYTGRGQFDEGNLARSIAALQEVYRRNVFPLMKVTFGVYPDNIGHTTSNGCFRCHDGGHVAADGTAISADCDYCHQIE